MLIKQCRKYHRKSSLMPSSPLPRKVLSICFIYANSLLYDSGIDSKRRVIIRSLDYFPKQASLWKPILSVIRQKILPSSNLMPDLRRPKSFLVFYLMIIFLGANHKAGLFLGLTPFDSEFPPLASLHLISWKTLNLFFLFHYHYLRIFSLVIYSVITLTC